MEYYQRCLNVRLIFLKNTYFQTKQIRPIYIGRPAAAPAPGIHSRHVIEQEKLVAEALGAK
jgi:hypothetical protein